jgi:excisionase family DNA binding protein
MNIKLNGDTYVPLPSAASHVNSQCVSCSLKYREWMTTDEAAEYLGIPVGSLRNMTSNGKIPHYKLGNRNRYRVDDLRQLLLSRIRGVNNGN